MIDPVQPSSPSEGVDNSNQMPPFTQGNLSGFLEGFQSTFEKLMHDPADSIPSLMCIGTAVKDGKQIAVPSGQFDAQFNFMQMAIQNSTMSDQDKRAATAMVKSIEHLLDGFVSKFLSSDGKDLPSKHLLKEMDNQMHALAPFLIPEKLQLTSDGFSQLMVEVMEEVSHEINSPKLHDSSHNAWHSYGLVSALANLDVFYVKSTQPVTKSNLLTPIFSDLNTVCSMGGAIRQQALANLKQEIPAFIDYYKA